MSDSEKAIYPSVDFRVIKAIHKRKVVHKRILLHKLHAKGTQNHSYVNFKPSFTPLYSSLILTPTSMLLQIRIDSEEGIALRICLDPLPPSIAAHRAGEVLFAISSHLSSTRSSHLFSSSATYSYVGDIPDPGSPNSRKSASPIRLSASKREEILKTKRREVELEKQVKYLAEELKKHEKGELFLYIPFLFLC
jgi:hypothetical protein